MIPVLDFTTPVDIVPAVSAYRRRKFVTPHSPPRPPVITRPVPVAVSIDEVVIIIVKEIIGAPIGHRKPVVIQIDEIGPDFKRDVRPASHAHG
jgi:hypothetical protein